MAMIKIVNGVEEQMTAEEETAFLAHREELRVQIEAENAAIAQNIANKASGKAKLKAGEALNDAELSALFGDN